MTDHDLPIEDEEFEDDDFYDDEEEHDEAAGGIDLKHLNGPAMLPASGGRAKQMI